MAEARITFYEIELCAYFKRGQDTPLFGDLSSTLTDLKNWSDGIQFGATHMKGVDGRGCYLIEANRLGNTNDWLLVLWNESHSHENSVPSVHLNSTKGSPDIRLNGVEEGTVPGFPTYFLVLPDSNRFATIKFQGDSSCLANIQKYIQGFMLVAASSAVYRDDPSHPDNRKLLGHALPSDASRVPLKVRPKFRFRVKARAAEIQFLRDNRPRIRTVIREELLHAQLVEERTKLSRLMNFLKGDDASGSQVVQSNVKVQVAVDYTPTEDELDQFVAAFDDTALAEDTDIGFKLSGESKTRWLGHGIATDMFSLNDVQQQGGVVTMSSLALALGRERARLLQLANG